MNTERMAEYRSAEENFFDLDHENKIAHIVLQYEQPGDIFEQSMRTKIPRLCSDFIDWIISSFDYVPKKYKADLCISFDDMGGYTTQQLEDIFRKNFQLELKIRNRQANKQKTLALLLCLIGFAFIAVSFFVNKNWQDEGTLKEVIAYVLDIAATVPFWGALDILLIENSERRGRLINLGIKFHKLTVCQAE